eukprot:7045708-Pyramimonas_sp.AAC.1
MYAPTPAHARRTGPRASVLTQHRKGCEKRNAFTTQHVVRTDNKERISCYRPCGPITVAAWASRRRGRLTLAAYPEPLDRTPPL